MEEQEEMWFILVCFILWSSVGQKGGEMEAVDKQALGLRNAM